MAGSWVIINGRRIYSGDNGPETAIGTEEPETMGGRAGDDALYGGGGDDQIDGGHGNDTLFGGDGNDTLWDGSDLSGGAPGPIGRDRLFGEEGDDLLRVWSPDTGDFVDGGPGIDTLEVRFNHRIGPLPGNPPVTFTLLPGASSVIRLNNINTVVVSNVEKLFFVGNSGADIIVGAQYDDTLIGNGGNDVLRGGGGNDSLDSGTGIVNIDGGDGVDSVAFDLSAAITAITVRNQPTISLGIHGTIRNAEILTNFKLGSGNDRVLLTQTQSSSFETGAGADLVTAVGSVNAFTGAGNDTLLLGDQADYVDPGTGADLVRLGGGNDRLDYTTTGSRAGTDPDIVFGEGGNDAIYTAAGNDSLDGGDGNDTIFAGGGADRVIGGAGDDIINGEAGPDTIYGLAGNDTITTDYDYWTDTTPFDADAAYGGDGNDSITGGYGPDTLDGGAGDDTIAPAWRIYDGTGLSFDTAADLVRGGAGNDVLKLSSLVNGGETHQVKLHLKPGRTDVVFNGDTIGSALQFEALDVAIFGEAGHDIRGGALADRIVVGNGNDSIASGDGADTIDANRGSDTVIAGSGADRVTLTLDGTDIVLLGDGDDVLTAFGIFASDPAPVAGGGVLDGGDGFDTLLLSGGGRGVTLNGKQLIIEGVVVATVVNFERIVFGGSALSESVRGSDGDDVMTLGNGNDTGFGGGGADSLDGGAGNDSLFGGDGADTISGGTGADTLQGGNGDDLLLLAFDGLADTVNGGGGFDLLRITGTPAGTVTMSGTFPGAVAIAVDGVTAMNLIGVEAISVAGGAGADSLFGGNAGDTLDGGAGADTLRGNGGDDLLISANGQGPDRLEGGPGIDLARIHRSSATDAFKVSALLAGSVQTLIDGTQITGIERLDFRGGSGDDTLIGGAYDDTLSGNAGADSIVGGGGNDSLDGGSAAAADTILGGAGDDTVVSSGSGADSLSGGAGGGDLLSLSRFSEVVGITVDLGIAGVQILSEGTAIEGFERGLLRGGGGGDTFLGGGLDDSLYGNAGDDLLSGGGGNDLLEGGEGADSLAGGAGADTLAGGAGADTLTGGADADRFRFDSIANGGLDRITDFEAADILAVSRFGFSTALVSGGAVTLVSGAGPVAAASGPVFLHDTDSGVLFFDADGTGAGAAVAFAELLLGGGVATLDAGQILVL